MFSFLFFSSVFGLGIHTVRCVQSIEINHLVVGAKVLKEEVKYKMLALLYFVNLGLLPLIFLAQYILRSLTK